MSLSNSFFLYVPDKEKNCIFHRVYFFFHYLQFSFKHNIKMRNKNVVVNHIFLNVPDKDKNCISHRFFFHYLQISFSHIVKMRNKNTIIVSKAM